MDQILLSFLCGSAFIGGAAAVTYLVCIAINRSKNSKFNEELLEYWRKSNESHLRQIDALEKIAKNLEAKKNG